MSFTNQGVRDWYWQRLSAIVVMLYTLFMITAIGIMSPLSFAKWHSFFQSTPVIIITLVTLVNLLIHAWIGVWTIFTDYVKCHCLRFVLQSMTILSLLGYLAWGIKIVGSL